MPYIGSQQKKTTTSKNIPVGTLEELESAAKSFGVKIKEDKPSLFRRGLDIISRPLYASAGAAKALIKDENPLEEAWKGLKGEDKETYSDVLKEAGVENKWVRGGVGFALDVALDPSTYFGGALLKGIGKVAKIGGRGGLGIARKINPKSVASLEMAGNSLKDAFGHAFKFGFGTTKGLSDDVARFFNRVGIAKEDIVEKNIRALNNFDNKTLREATDIMLKNKRIEFAVREGKKSEKFIRGEGKTAEAVDVMKSIGAKIAKATELPEEKIYEHYFPSILNAAKRTAQEIPGGLKVGKEGYLKKFQDILKDEDLLKKPIEAYSRREFEVVRNKMTRETLNNFVETYGKTGTGVKAKDFKKMIDDGWRPLYEKGKAGLKLFKEAGDKLPKFAGIKKPLGWLKKEDFDFINSYMFPEMKTIDMLAKATGFDKFTRWFKTAVTAFFPAFHVRNFVSGNVQNYSVLGSQALNPTNHMNALGFMKGGNKKIKFKNWQGTQDDMAKILKENFKGSSRYISDLGDYIEDLGTKGFKVKSIAQKLNPRQVGEFIENWQKGTAISVALKKGHTIDDAVKLAEKAGFDYSKITKFESKIMRRLVPFYSFARKNAELQLATAIKNPERILNQIKFARNLSEIFGGGKPTEEDLRGLPPWALSGLGFKVEGNRYLTKFGLPLEEFVERINKPLMSTLSSANPLIKYPIESKMGYDFFREQDILDINKISPVSGKLIKEKAPEWMQEIFNVKEVTSGRDGKTRYYASPEALHLLRNIPTARFQNTLEKLFENDKESVDKWLAFISGAKIYDIDTDLQAYFKERDLREDIERDLMQKGIGREFRTFYIPRENQ